MKTIQEFEPIQCHCIYQNTGRRDFSRTAASIGYSLTIVDYIMHSANRKYKNSNADYGREGVDDVLLFSYLFHQLWLGETATFTGGGTFTKIVLGCAYRTSKSDFLYTIFLPDFPPISIPYHFQEKSTCRTSKI